MRANTAESLKKLTTEQNHVVSDELEAEERRRAKHTSVSSRTL